MLMYHKRMFDRYYCIKQFFRSKPSEKLLQKVLFKCTGPAPIAQLVECPLRGTGGHGFDPGPRHTKVVKMVLAAPRLALRLTG